MAKNRNLINNTFYNFKLRKRPSLFIGSYIILCSFFIKTTLKGFTTDSSPFGFLTVNYLEDFIFLLTILAFVFSLLSLFFGNRRHCRKIGNKLWNGKSKKMVWLVVFLITLFYCISFYFLRTGEEIFIIPSFIMFYGILLMTLNFSKHKAVYLFSFCCFCFGFIPLFFDKSGFFTLYILGISHYIYAYTNNIFE